MKWAETVHRFGISFFLVLFLAWGSPAHGVGETAVRDANSAVENLLRDPFNPGARQAVQHNTALMHAANAKISQLAATKQITPAQAEGLRMMLANKVMKDWKMDHHAGVGPGGDGPAASATGKGASSPAPNANVASGASATANQPAREASAAELYPSLLNEVLSESPHLALATGATTPVSAVREGGEVQGFAATEGGNAAPEMDDDGFEINSDPSTSLPPVIPEAGSPRTVASATSSANLEAIMRNSKLAQGSPDVIVFSKDAVNGESSAKTEDGSVKVYSGKAANVGSAGVSDALFNRLHDTSAAKTDKALASGKGKTRIARRARKLRALSSYVPRDSAPGTSGEAAVVEEPSGDLVSLDETELDREPSFEVREAEASRSPDAMLAWAMHYRKSLLLLALLLCLAWAGRGSFGTRSLPR